MKSLNEESVLLSTLEHMIDQKGEDRLAILISLIFIYLIFD